MNESDRTQLNELGVKFDNISKDVTEIKDSMARITQALVGNEFGDSGLVKRVERLELRVQELHDWKIKIAAYTAGAAAIGGSGASVLTNFLF